MDRDDEDYLLQMLYQTGGMTDRQYCWVENHSTQRRQSHLVKKFQSFCLETIERATGFTRQLTKKSSDIDSIVEFV